MRMELLSPHPRVLLWQEEQELEPAAFEAPSEVRGSPRDGLLQVFPLSHQLPAFGTKSKPGRLSLFYPLTA